MKKYFYFILCVLFVGCSNPSKDLLRKFVGSYKGYFNVKGKVIGNRNNGRYYSPNKVFSVDLVDLLGPGVIVYDSFRKDFGKNPDYNYNIGTVSFSDDFGTFYRIDTFEIPEKRNFSKNQLELLLDASMEYEMTLYRELDPNSKVLYKNFLEINNRYIGYYIVHLANGSNYSVNGSRVDVFRSSFVFLNKDYIYVISNQYMDKDRWRFTGKIELNDKVIKEIQEKLTKIYKTMEFSDEKQLKK